MNFLKDTILSSPLLVLQNWNGHIAIGSSSKTDNGSPILFKKHIIELPNQLDMH